MMRMLMSSETQERLLRLANEAVEIVQNTSPSFYLEKISELIERVDSRARRDLGELITYKLRYNKILTPETKIFIEEIVPPPPDRTRSQPYQASLRIIKDNNSSSYKNAVLDMKTRREKFMRERISSSFKNSIQVHKNEKANERSNDIDNLNKFAIFHGTYDGLTMSYNHVEKDCQTLSSVIMMAIEQENIEVLDNIKTEFKLNLNSLILDPTEMSCTPLAYAAYANQFRAVSYLLNEAKVNINTAISGPKQNLVALQYASSAKMIKFLVSQGACVDAKTDNELTTLGLTILDNNYDLVQSLIFAGANPSFGILFYCFSELNYAYLNNAIWQRQLDVQKQLSLTTAFQANIIDLVKQYDVSEITEGLKHSL